MNTNFGDKHTVNREHSHPHLALFVKNIINLVFIMFKYIYILHGCNSYNFMEFFPSKIELQHFGIARFYLLSISSMHKLLVSLSP